MAYTTIDDPTSFFNTVLYTGDLQDSDGTGHTQSITGVGFQPDWVWHKGRSGARTHMLVDRVRGVSSYNWLASSGSGAELTTNTNGAISSIDSDGITVQNGNDSSSKSNNAGKNGETWVFWNWLAGGSASSNTDGSITSSVSANTTAGFSIVGFTGNAQTGTTIAHGLGVKPNVIILKNRGPDVANWQVYHSSLTATHYIQLNSTGAATDSNTRWNDTEPTSTVFTTGSSGDVKGDSSGETFIAYCFTSKKGFSKFGSYTGNGNADGPFVYTGFRPAWVMIKKTSGTGNWMIMDNKRSASGGFNVLGERIKANTNEAGSTADYQDNISNGFKIRTTASSWNDSGGTYIYLAFAESPFVNSNGIPNNAR
jgi:hypothetical protein